MKQKVEELICELQDNDAGVRKNAARVLFQMGEEAVEAVPALTLALIDDFKIN